MAAATLGACDVIQDALGRRQNHGFDCRSYRGRSCRMQGSHPHRGAREVDGPPPPPRGFSLCYYILKRFHL